MFEELVEENEIDKDGETKKQQRTSQLDNKTSVVGETFQRMSQLGASLMNLGSDVKMDNINPLDIKFPDVDTCM